MATTGPYLPNLHVAGTVLTNAEITAWIRAIRYEQGVPLAGDEEAPFAVLKQTVAQSLANNVATAVLFDSEAVDTANAHSTSTNTSRWTCPATKTGWFPVTASVGFASNATGDRAAWFQINGAGKFGIAFCPAAGAHQTALSIATVVNLTPGDFLEVGAEQYSGGALNTDLTFPARMSIYQRRVQ